MTTCTYDYLNRDPFSRFINAFILLGGFFIPLVVITTSYVLLYYKLRTRCTSMTTMFDFVNVKRQLMNGSKSNIDNEQDIKSQRERFSINTMKIDGSRSVNSFIGNKINASSHVSYETRVAKKTTIMVLVFLIGWGPYAIITLLAQYFNEPSTLLNPHTATLPAILAKFSTFINPFVYSISYSDVSLKKCLVCRRKKDHIPLKKTSMRL